MTPEQASLFNQMKKLSKQANQRILRLERLTGKTESFATKQLFDFLSSKDLDVITKTGRIGTKKTLTNLEMKAVIKAMERFIATDVSRVAGVKAYVKKLSTESNKPISFKQADVVYQAEKSYTWIYQYIPR